MENIRQVINYKRVFRLDHPTNFGEMAWDKLEETRSTIMTALDMFLDEMNKEKRDLSTSEYSACERAHAYVDQIDSERERRLANGSQEPIQPRTVDHSTRAQMYNAVEHGALNGGAGVGRSYRDLFHDGDKNRTLEDGEFKSFKEFCEVLHGGKHDARMERRTHFEGVGALGGAAVPEQFAEAIWKPVLESSIVMPRAYVIPIKYGSSYYQPVIKNFSHVGGIYGVVPVWTAEAATGTNQDLTFGSVELNVYKCLLYMAASNELVADGIGIEKQITDAMRQALAWTCDTEFLTGSGVARPQGILNAASKVNVSRDTANDVKYADICNMFSRLYPGCVANSVWIVTVSALPRLTQMADAASNLIWQPNAVGASPGTIFGRPVLLTEKIPALGSEGDVILADLSQYCIGMRSDITLDKSNGPGFMQDVMSYRAGIRLNGLPLWESAITPANGSDDLSWCVVLD